ncbi:hypothetical protein C8A05DRAFT_13832 [Staphylotrichum tortipilum]|uniref:Uncharacterized protein n=1 Tax=Staphylotrichum tortipilum TaxID=2831512 RepID=A0AAN6MPV6_9PEZI|nr:hypothetical protein C8A05DRAFT_13832 [Staphylotrichum longicolle]
MLGREAAIEDAVQAQMAGFLRKLREFRQHTDQLGSCFAAAPVAHPALGDVLLSAVSRCHDSMASVEASIIAGQAAEAFACYEALVATHIRLFILGTQLLIMGSLPDQQSKMASPAARAIVDAALEACRAVALFERLSAK